MGGTLKVGGESVFLAKKTQERYGTGMKKVAINELSQPVRSFLDQVKNGEAIVVQDEQGRSRYGVVPYIEATPAERERAWKEIEKIQRKVGKTMQKKGLTEDDFDRLLQEEE